MCQILLENEISIFKKLVSRRKHEVLQNFLVNGCSDVGFQKTQWTDTSRWHCTPNHHRLWKLNTGLQATWAMSFSTLPPDSRTLVSKWDTKLALIWKEDYGPLGNSPVILLLSPGKTPQMTTVAKFLDMFVCGGPWCLDPSLSPFHVKLTQILESILLDNPHKSAVLSVGFASFSSTQLSVNMLRSSTLWTASLFGNECSWVTLLVKGVEGSQMLFYVWFEFTSWLRGVGQGKGVWDRFLTIWARQLCLCLYCNGKINDYWEIEPLICKWLCPGQMWIR